MVDVALATSSLNDGFQPCKILLCQRDFHKAKKMALFFIGVGMVSRGLAYQYFHWLFGWKFKS